MDLKSSSATFATNSLNEVLLFRRIYLFILTQGNNLFFHKSFQTFLGLFHVSSAANASTKSPTWRNIPTPIQVLSKSGSCQNTSWLFLNRVTMIKSKWEALHACFSQNYTRHDLPTVSKYDFSPDWIKLINFEREQKFSTPLWYPHTCCFDVFFFTWVARTEFFYDSIKPTSMRAGNIVKYLISVGIGNVGKWLIWKAISGWDKWLLRARHRGDEILSRRDSQKRNRPAGLTDRPSRPQQLIRISRRSVPPPDILNLQFAIRRSIFNDSGVNWEFKQKQLWIIFWFSAKIESTLGTKREAVQNGRVQNHLRI